MSGHRWSGWPGAWCLDCGCNHNLEAANACLQCITPYPGNDCEIILCSEHLKTQEPNECPEPESNRHNPYMRKQ